MVAERRAVGAHRDGPLAIDDLVADRCGAVGASGLAHLVALALCAADREDRAHALDQRVVECAEPRVAGIAFVERRHPFIAERFGQRMSDVAKRTGSVSPQNRQRPFVPNVTPGSPKLPWTMATIA